MRTAARTTYFAQAARCSNRRGSSTRSFAGTIASISCVSAPNAHTRPQYSRPHSTVDTTTKTENTYHARLYLNGGRLRSASRNTSLIDTRLLFMNPMYPTAATSAAYFNRTLLRKKLTSVSAMNAVSSARSSACGARISPQVSPAPTTS